MSKSKSMSKPAAARIQKAAVTSSKSGNTTKGSFAARAQSAADKNSSK
ncbi:hypothetical protein EC396_09155 [Lutibacter sp. HS1-25]|nr:hypothetical protein [Lutibacter sp. HS1-25]RXP54539.1 hypothetical protein EC396_09155 [Lutibacter sp. HS1-25]